MRVRSLLATSSHLNPREVIGEEEILERLITPSPYFTTEEKTRMVKLAYSNADCFHWEPIKKAVFYIIIFLVVFFFLYSVLHIGCFYKIITQLFLSYTEWVIIPLIGIFSALISHYIYIAYIQYKSLKQIK